MKYNFFHRPSSIAKVHIVEKYFLSTLRNITTKIIFSIFRSPKSHDGNFTFSSRILPTSKWKFYFFIEIIVKYWKNTFPQYILLLCYSVYEKSYISFKILDKVIVSCLECYYSERASHWDSHVTSNNYLILIESLFLTNKVCVCQYRYM